MANDDLPLLTFVDAAAFEAWLANQSVECPGAWLRFAKLSAPATTVSKSDAIDSALAHGWIDGQLGRLDANFFKTRFTPRRPSSVWSQVNRDRVAKLTASGRMTSRGQARVDEAKADGRWDRAYAPASSAKPDVDLEAAFDLNPEARAAFNRLDAANRYAVLYRVQTAAPAKRAAKIANLVAMLARGETIHPRRVGKSSALSDGR